MDINILVAMISKRDARIAMRLEELCQKVFNNLHQCTPLDGEKREKMKGYVMLPCFTVEIDENGGCEMTCNNFLGWVFETFFAPFWHGKVTVLDNQ